MYNKIKVISKEGKEEEAKMKELASSFQREEHKKKQKFKSKVTVQLKGVKMSDQEGQYDIC